MSDTRSYDQALQTTRKTLWLVAGLSGLLFGSYLASCGAQPLTDLSQSIDPKLAGLPPLKENLSDPIYAQISKSVHKINFLDNDGNEESGTAIIINVNIQNNSVSFLTASHNLTEKGVDHTKIQVEGIISDTPWDPPVIKKSNSIKQIGGRDIGIITVEYQSKDKNYVKKFIPLDRKLLEQVAPINWAPNEVVVVRPNNDIVALSSIAPVEQHKALKEKRLLEFVYQLDPGNSGSPVFDTVGGVKLFAGIVTQGIDRWLNKFTAITPLTEEMLKEIKTYLTTS